jgi:uncharacterized protein (TIGR03086 family)
MAKLSATERARLPDSAFAYVDAAGHRRLPINDEAHVRNALARFDRVNFENDAARTRARKRLLNAAKKFGIVPVGFITGQIESEGRHAAAGRLVIELDGSSAPEELEHRLRRVLRDPTLSVLHWSDGAGSYVDHVGRPVPAPVAEDGRAVTYLERGGRPMAVLEHDPAILDDPALTDTVLSAVRYMIEKERVQGELRAELADAASLPTGCVTFLLTDIEGSTAHLAAMGDAYAGLLAAVRRIVRDGVLEAGGREVDARADEFFAVFERTQPAIQAAVVIQRAMAAATWPGDMQCRVRAGIHTGRPTLTETGYIGLSVHAAARVCYAGHGGQIVISADAIDAAKEEGPEIDGIRYRTLGRHRMAGLPRAMALFQVEADGLAAEFPPLRIGSVEAIARGVRSATPGNDRSMSSTQNDLTREEQEARDQRPLGLLARASDQAGALIRATRPDQGEVATPCFAFDLRTLVNHIVIDLKKFTSSVTGEKWEDDGRDLIADDWSAAYSAAAGDLMDAWKNEGVVGRTLQLAFGPMPAEWCIAQHVADLAVHAWDIAKATELSTNLDEEVGEAALEFGRTSLRPEFRGDEGSGKAFGHEVAVDRNAPLYDRLAGVFGRDPNWAPPD